MSTLVVPPVDLLAGRSALIAWAAELVEMIAYAILVECAEVTEVVEMDEVHGMDRMNEEVERVRVGVVYEVDEM